MNKITIIFRSVPHHTEAGTTFEEFIRNNNYSSAHYSVNGAKTALNYELQHYNVIELQADSLYGTFVSEYATRELTEDSVTCFLCDFTGTASDIKLGSLVSQIPERYEVLVTCKIFRNSIDVTDQIEFLKEGDRIFVAPAMGLKGA